MECKLCQKKVVREDMDRHFKEDCPMIKVECPICGTKILRKDMEEHDAACPEKEIDCPQCGLKVKRGQLDEHNCLKSLVLVQAEQRQEIEILKKVNTEYEARFKSLEENYQKSLLQIANQFQSNMQ